MGDMLLDWLTALMNSIELPGSTANKLGYKGHSNIKEYIIVPKLIYSLHPMSAKRNWKVTLTELKHSITEETDLESGEYGPDAYTV